MYNSEHNAILRPKCYFTFICSRQINNTYTVRHNEQFFISVAQQPKSGLGRLSVEVSRSHTHTHTLGRTPLNERSARRQGHCVHNTNKHKRRTSTTSAEFEPATPAIEGLQTYVLHRTATGTGLTAIMCLKLIRIAIHLVTVL
jgi:hypothetical protein